MIQGGAGTSMNMNANEVIATELWSLWGTRKGNTSSVRQTIM